MGRLAFHGSKHEHLNVIQAVFEARKKKARRVLLSNPIAVRNWVNSFDQEEERKGRNDVRATIYINSFRFVSCGRDAIFISSEWV